MVHEEVRRLCENLAQTCRASDTKIEDAITLLSFYYSNVDIPVKTDEDAFRKKADKMLVQLGFTPNSKLFSQASEFLLIAYEREDLSFQVKDLSSALAKRMGITYNSATCISSKIIWRIVDWIRSNTDCDTRFFSSANYVSAMVSEIKKL